MGLRSYIITRILLTIPTLLLLLSMVFLIMRVLPGDPVALHFEKKATPEQMESMRRALGLDKPLWTQYIEYLGGLVDIGYILEHGYPNLGKSMQTFEEVGGQIFSAFPATLELAFYSMIIASVIGILLGVISSKSYNSILDHLIRGVGTVTYAVPIFFLGIVFQLIFGVYLRWLPTGLRINPVVDPPATITGLYTIDSLLQGNLFKFFESLKALLLPSLTLGIILSGMFVRMTRTNMLETLRLDFVTAAKARGLKESTVTYGYALRNAFLPILTMMGLQFAILLGGAILTETTFSWPGLGRYIVDRINFRDYTAIQGAVVVFGLFVTLVSLVVDILYAYLDPRIRL
ncbi:ABC transporter permease [Candidatus Bathyarchaeota archaeon]|nr:ABC transporter permease [Candidatus Bathyarchaeota archaeon]